MMEMLAHRLTNTLQKKQKKKVCSPLCFELKLNLTIPMQDPSVTRRAMDYYKFMNSKVLFKHLRHNAELFKSTKPVMVHVNYHPDKFERMKAVWANYIEGDDNALERFPDGSE